MRITIPEGTSVWLDGAATASVAFADKGTSLANSSTTLGPPSVVAATTFSFQLTRFTGGCLRALPS